MCLSHSVEKEISIKCSIWGVYIYFLRKSHIWLFTHICLMPRFFFLSQCGNSHYLYDKCMQIHRATNVRQPISKKHSGTRSCSGLHSKWQYMLQRELTVIPSWFVKAFQWGCVVKAVTITKHCWNKWPSLVLTVVSFIRPSDDKI